MLEWLLPTVGKIKFYHKWYPAVTALWNYIILLVSNSGLNNLGKFVGHYAKILMLKEANELGVIWWF